MADSNRLAVLKNIQTTLQGMTGGTYHYPLTVASQVIVDPTVNLLTAPGSEQPIYLLEPTPSGVKEYWPGEQVTEEFIVTITGRKDADASDVAAKMTVWEHMAADIELALQADTTRGGHACDTRLGVPQPFVGVGSSIVLLVQPVRVTIYRAYRDGVGS